MTEPTSDTSYHRAIIVAALITASAGIIGAFIQRGVSLESFLKFGGRTRTIENAATNLSSDTAGANALPSGLRALTARAETGEREAQVELADVYNEGAGVARNYSRALYWYRQAATAGDIRAARQLDWMLTRGIGTSVNRAEAVRWFRTAADAGDARAANYLGWAYVQGWGVTVDYSLARFWLEKSASANDRLGLYNLGFVYERGLGATADLPGAISLYKRSASAGYAAAHDALRRLGVNE